MLLKKEAAPICKESVTGKHLVGAYTHTHAKNKTLEVLPSHDGKTRAEDAVIAATPAGAARIAIGKNDLLCLSESEGGRAMRKSYATPEKRKCWVRFE